MFVRQYGHLELVKFLLQDPRVDPSVQSNRAFRKACTSVDPSAEDNKAIRKSSKKGHIKIVKLLLEDLRVDISARNYEALSLASNNYHFKIAKLLYDKKESKGK